MDTNSLMDLDDSSFMSYIEDHIIRNGWDAILKDVALNGGDYDENSNDSHSRDSSDDSSNQTGNDDDDFEKGYDSNEDEVAIGSQRLLGDALPILDSRKIHAPIVHQHIHCPPLDDMSAVFQGNPHGICDCDDFCFAECLQDGDFEYFKTANFAIAFDEILLKSIESVDCVERRSNNELRKALSEKTFALYILNY